MCLDLHHDMQGLQHVTFSKGRIAQHPLQCMWDNTNKRYKYEHCACAELRRQWGGPVMGRSSVVAPVQLLISAHTVEENLSFNVNPI